MPQEPAWQHSSAAQAFPHAPQLAASVLSSTQVFAHSVPSQAEHDPAIQLWRAAQTLPQAPQLSGSEPRSAHWSLHCALLAGHGAHAPALHASLAEQCLPHEPQLLASVCRFAHVLPHAFAPSQHESEATPPSPSPATGAQLLEVILLLSRVTAPLRASALPSRLAPVVSAMLVSARMLPTKEVEVPTVAELPTCQNTLQGLAPLTRRTEAPLEVVSLLPI